MPVRRGIALAIALSMGMSATWGQPTTFESPTAEEAKEQKPPDRLKIGSVAGLPRPEGFAVEDLRSAEMRTATPFKQTYQAPIPGPFTRQTFPLARYQRNVGDAELSVSPVELLTEKLIERYGDRLKGKRLTVREFTYGLEQVINKHQGMTVMPLDAGSVVFALIATAAGTAIMQGKGIDLRLTVKIDAELDGRRIEALEPAMTLSAEDAPARITRYAVERFLHRFDSAVAEPNDQRPPGEGMTQR